MDSTVSADLFRIIKIEPILPELSGDYQQGKEVYEQEIIRLRRNHDEQIVKLCQELEKSSVVIHQMKFELDSTRVLLHQKDKQIQSTLIEDLRMKNKDLTCENIQLKKQLINLKTEYEILFKDMQDAREYLLTLINH